MRKYSTNAIYRASDILRKESKISWDFQGQIRGKSAYFAGFSRDKSENLQKNWPISWEKSQNSQKNWPISREISGRNFAKKQSVKNSDFAGFLLANCAKIDQFCVDMTNVV